MADPVPGSGGGMAHAQPDEATAAAQAEEAERRAASYIAWGLPAVSIAGAIVARVVSDLGTAILVLAGGALLGVITVLWASVRTLAGEAPITVDEALALGAPSAAEEQKRAVLRALKDLEFERSVGKIDDADYEMLLRRYRAEAKVLLRARDQDLEPLRARALRYAEEQLAATDAPRGRKKKARAAAEAPDAAPGAPSAEAPKARPECPACHAANDADAVFCKKCGGKLSPDAGEDRGDAPA